MPMGREIGFRIVQFGLLAARAGADVSPAGSILAHAAQCVGGGAGAGSMDGHLQPDFLGALSCISRAVLGVAVLSGGPVKGPNDRCYFGNRVGLSAFGGVAPTASLARELPEPAFSHLLWSAVLMFGLALEWMARAPLSDP